MQCQGYQQCGSTFIEISVDAVSGVSTVWQHFHRDLSRCSVRGINSVAALSLAMGLLTLSGNRPDPEESHFGLRISCMQH